MYIGTIKLIKLIKLNYINMFKTLQKRAYDELVKFKNKEKFDNHTGIEDHLRQPYLDQIIDLNKYVITDASTNIPNNIYFSPMFVEGVIENRYVEKFVELLNNHDVSYFVGSHSKYHKDLKYLSVIQDMYEKWWFNTKKTPDYCNYSAIQKNHKYIKLAQKVRKHNIRKVNMLNDDELNLIKEILDTTEYGKFVKNCGWEDGYSYSDLDLDTSVVESTWTEFDVLRNDVVRFCVIDNDVFKRTLYEDILKIFNEIF